MESIKVDVDGVDYVPVAEVEKGSCEGCAAFICDNDGLCDSITDQISSSCLERKIIWAKKEDTQKQVELKVFFGSKPITYQILEHTDEEEEAWQEAQKKVATGVTDGPRMRRLEELGQQLPLFPELEQPVHRQVGGSHYFNPIQPWDIIRAWELNYWEGNIVKYVLRHKGKNKVEDLEKARHYLDYLIENYDELYPVSD